ncbi:BamA/TamA family outer membrane protein [Sulfurivermis fontis]|uniref:BamA/TamA family outer membrane protein n=1 Tax=Sulfurivermis fontis TaxID=1972068 RepID=UPI000FDA3138|nr:BamA/TamA family outer membrane protein [Sulfurivermis fontis]
MRLLTIFMSCLLLLGEAHGAVLAAIRFAGNATTRPEVMLQEMTIAAGDVVDAERIEESRQAIMNLGLFKSVQAELREEEVGTVLLITVVEKWYILPIPRIGVRGDGETEYGMELRFDNLFGLNQHFEVESIIKESLDSGTPARRELSVGYSYPRIVGTPYRLDVGGGEVQRVERQLDTAGAETGRYEQTTHNLRFGLYRWQSVTGPSRGLRYGGGMAAQWEDYRYLEGDAVPYQDARDVQLNGLVELNEVDEERYRRRGRVYGYSAELAVPQWGDFSYHRHLFYYRRHLPLDQKRSNLDYRFQLGMAKGTAFNRYGWYLGGSTTLRGYDKDYVAGNAMLLSNIEYLFPVSGYPQMRGVLFSDVGNAWREVSDMDLTDLKVSLGLGLRWRVQTFVNVTIRLDYAWGLAADTQGTYLSTHTMF